MIFVPLKEPYQCAGAAAFSLPNGLMARSRSMTRGNRPDSNPSDLAAFSFVTHDFVEETKRLVAERRSQGPGYLNQSRKEVFPLVWAVFGVSGPRKIDILCKGKPPFLLECKQVYGKEVKLSDDKAGRLKFRSSRQSDQSPIACITLELSDVSVPHLPDRVCLERLDFNADPNAFIAEADIAFFRPIMVVILDHVSDALVGEPHLSQLIFAYIAEGDATKAGVCRDDFA